MATSSGHRHPAPPTGFGAVWRGVVVVGSAAATVAIAATAAPALPDAGAGAGAGGALRAGGLTLVASFALLGSAFGIRRVLAVAGVGADEAFVPAAAPAQLRALGDRLARRRPAAVATALVAGLVVGWLGGVVNAPTPDAGTTTVAHAGAVSDEVGDTVADGERFGVSGADADDASSARDESGVADDATGSDTGGNDEADDDGSAGDESLARDGADDSEDSDDPDDGANDPAPDTCDAGDLLDGVIDTVDDLVDETCGTVDETVDDAEDTVDDGVDDIEDTVDETADDVLDTPGTTVPALPGL